MNKYRLIFEGLDPHGWLTRGCADIEHNCEENARRKLIIYLGAQGYCIRRIDRTTIETSLAELGFEID